MTKSSKLLPALVTVSVLVVPALLAAARSEPPEPSALARTIAAARDAGPGPFDLRVDSTGAVGHRSLEVFPSGVAIWNGRAQLRLAPAQRSALLEALLAGGFPSLEPSYGGRPGAAPERAALRVVRRVVLEIGGLSASSVQLAEGEQSTKLERLAEGLLDLVAPLAGDGVTADDLGNGLAKLATGVLAPETFTLRFVELPPPGSEAAGSILRVSQGTATRQSYTPGREIGEPVSQDLSDEQLGALVAALRAAGLSTLPVNLWSDDHLELELTVLEHRQSLVARPFSRLSPEALGEAQQRFEKLVAALQDVRSSLAS
jgi:hypothetical protein